MIQEQNKKGETSVQSTIGRVRGQPLLIEEVLDLKLRSMLVNLRTADAGINIQVVSGVLNGSIRANPERFGKYMDFKVTRSQVQPWYQSMKFSCRAVTTSRPVITRSLWAEVRSQFFHEITDKVLQHNIPDELIINVDQTPSKFVATNNITMAAKREKNISRAGATDKRAINVTLCESLYGCMLLFQLSYTGKMESSLVDFTFPERFCLGFNQKYWSNETKTIRLLKDLLVPYIKKVKEEKSLTQSQKSLLVWDAFKAHARVMTDMYQHLKSRRGKEIIKAGQRAAGIIDILKDDGKKSGILLG